MTFTPSFINQTSQDYDISLHEVERIAHLASDSKDYYERLESYLKDRANKNNPPLNYLKQVS